MQNIDFDHQLQLHCALLEASLQARPLQQQESWWLSERLPQGQSIEAQLRVLDEQFQ